MGNETGHGARQARTRAACPAEATRDQLPSPRSLRFERLFPSLLLQRSLELTLTSRTCSRLPIKITLLVPGATRCLETPHSQPLL